MAGSQTPNNYTLGRGELWFAKYKSGTSVPSGERYIGNTPEFNTNFETENLDHFNSDRGVNEKDASIVLSLNRTASFITDNISPTNLAFFFFGSVSALAVASSTVTDEEIKAVEKGLAYPLGVTTTNPAGTRSLDIHTPAVTGPPAVPAKNIIVKASGGSAFTEGTDFDVDMDLARVTILTGGTIPADSDILVSYKTKSSTRERIISGNTPIEGALRFVSYNPAGKRFNWYMPWVKLSPNGDYALKGDEWQQIPFTVEILKKTGLEAIYIDGEPMTV